MNKKFYSKNVHTRSDRWFGLKYWWWPLMKLKLSCIFEVCVSDLFFLLLGEKIKILCNSERPENFSLVRIFSKWTLTGIFRRVLFIWRELNYSQDNAAQREQRGSLMFSRGQTQKNWQIHCNEFLKKKNFVIFSGVFYKLYYYSFHKFQWVIWTLYSK